MTGSADHTSLLAAAKLNRLLRAIPDAVLRRVLSRASLAKLEQGRRLYRQDARIRTVYFPTEGVVSVLVGTRDNKPVELATVGNEGLVGTPVAIGVPFAPGHAVVQVPGTAIVVQTHNFEEALHREDALRDVVQRYSYLFLRQVMQSGACNRLHSMEERCARWLLMAHDRAGTDQFPLTQHFIAEMLGTRRANVNVALALLRRAGAIEHTYRRITILDRRELESFSCPCYELLRSVEQSLTA